MTDEIIILHYRVKDENITEIGIVKSVINDNLIEFYEVI